MKKNKFTLFLIVSVLVHLLIGTIVQWIAESKRENKPKEFVTFEIVEPPTAEQKEKGQIVDQSDVAINDDIPDEAKFLSAHNQKVIKETKAQNHGQFKNEVGGAPQQDTKIVEEKKPREDEGESHPKKKLLAKLTPNYNWQKVEENNSGPATTDDYLKEINNGAQTLLSTREFVYFSYYRRIKNQLSQYWEPKIKIKVQKLMRQGRQIANTGDKVTRVVITLDKNGILTRVQIVSQSGLSDLDDAAVEAFRAAAPFPHPPKGIVDNHGQIKITWDFVLEV